MFVVSKLAFANFGFLSVFDFLGGPWQTFSSSFVQRFVIESFGDLQLAMPKSM